VTEYLTIKNNGAILPTDSNERKEIPIFSGVIAYFPLALAAVARVSKRGNDKHNPGQPMHWAREKSTDHEDCIARHLIDVNTLDPKTGEYEDAMALAWRALAKLQLLEEKRLGKPPSPGSRAHCGAQIGETFTCSRPAGHEPEAHFDYAKWKAWMPGDTVADLDPPRKHDRCPE